MLNNSQQQTNNDYEIQTNDNQKESRKEKESFVFYRSFFNAISSVQDKNARLDLYDMIAKFALNNELPATSEPLINAVFQLIKPLIENADRRYITSVENGKKGGAPKGNKNALKKQPKQPKNNLNVNDNVNKNENVNENFNESENEKEIVVSQVNSPSQFCFSLSHKKTDTHNKVGERGFEETMQNEISLSQKDYLKFKENFPSKEIRENQEIPKDFDMDKLIQAVKESEFLSSNNNLSFEWLIDRYDKITSGNYKNFTKRTTSTKSQDVVITHNYTDEQLSSFFTDLDKLDL